MLNEIFKLIIIICKIIYKARVSTLSALSDY